MRFLKYFFGFLTILGLFLFAARMASHDYFPFRPNMAEDWIMFGTPITGLIGLMFTWLMEGNVNNEGLKTQTKSSIEFQMLLMALDKAMSVLRKIENAREFADKLEIIKRKIQQLELSELENLWIWFAPTGVWDEIVGESGIELGTEIFELTEKLRSQVN